MWKCDVPPNQPVFQIFGDIFDIPEEISPHEAIASAPQDRFGSYIDNHIPGNRHHFLFEFGRTSDEGCHA